jgi:hypothetical protein
MYQGILQFNGQFKSEFYNFKYFKISNLYLTYRLRFTEIFFFVEVMYGFHSGLTMM